MNHLQEKYKQQHDQTCKEYEIKLAEQKKQTNKAKKLVQTTLNKSKSIQNKLKKEIKQLKAVPLASSKNHENETKELELLQKKLDDSISSSCNQMVEIEALKSELSKTKPSEGNQNDLMKEIET